MSEVFEVGGFAYYSWGYDQTNVDWFKVVKRNDKSVWFEAVQSKKDYSNSHMSGYSVPVDVPQMRVQLVEVDGEWQNVQVQEKFRKLVKGGYKGEMAGHRFGNIYPWNGKPQFFSEWA